jgi:DNA primase catalytic core
MDEIRERVPISSVVGRRVTFDKRKTNASRGDFWGCCPFHGEKSPSFHCEDRKGRYHCFGCGVSGDHFRFLVELDGVSFPEAVEQIAAMAGVPMPARDPETEKREKEKTSLFDVMELASAFFEEQLQLPSGARARGYLRERGLSAQTQQTFRIGYAPESRNALKTHLANKGVAKEKIEACGLVVFGDDIAVSYDRFRDRIMFPIQDVRGRIVGFGGRAMNPNDKAKYLNSPETELFHKGRNLFNVSRAKEGAGDKNDILVVEGYIDAISLYQAGIRNVVAPLGTALTEDQLELVWRFSKNPIVCFDGDDAGVRAANRVIDNALPKLKTGHSVRFMTLPDGQDPDDFIRIRGKAEFLRLQESSVPLHEFFMLRHEVAPPDSTPERLALSEKEIYNDIDKITDPLIKRYYRSHVRLRLYEKFGKFRNPEKIAKISHNELAENVSLTQKIILGLCVEYPGIIVDYVEQLSSLAFSNPLHSLFYQGLHKLYVEYPDLTTAKIYERIDKSFYFILDSLHGTEGIKTVRPNSSGYSPQIKVERGYKLREMFPFVSNQPTYELVKMIINFFLKSLELSRVEKEYFAQVKAQSESEDDLYEPLYFEEMHRQIVELRRILDDDRREIDLEIEAQTGRLSYVA